MKKYSIIDLYVVEKDEHKFICEYFFKDEYIEVLTKEKIKVNNKEKVERLVEYYSILERICLDSKKPLMLTKKDILLKYIKINEKVRNKDININDFLKKQEDELKGLKLLAKENPELAKKEALEKLQRTGILDENGELIGPYKEIFVKEEKQKILSNQKIDN